MSVKLFVVNLPIYLHVASSVKSSVDMSPCEKSVDAYYMLFSTIALIR